MGNSRRMGMVLIIINPPHNQISRQEKKRNAAAA